MKHPIFFRVLLNVSYEALSGAITPYYLVREFVMWRIKLKDDFTELRNKVKQTF